LTSADVSPASARIVSACLRQVSFEVLLAEPHRPSDPQVWQAAGSRELVDRRDRKTEQVGDLTSGEELMVEPDNVFAHFACRL
jgi:hypothetical protein